MSDSPHRKRSTDSTVTVSPISSSTETAEEEIKTPDAPKKFLSATHKTSHQHEILHSTTLMEGKTDMGHNFASTTLTASETEEQILGMLKETNDSEEFVGLKSAYRGKLSLISAPSSRKRYAGDITSGDFSTPKRAKRNLRTLKNTDHDKSKIKKLQCTVRRLRVRVEHLEGLLAQKKKQSRISESTELKASISGTA
ncbi:hypothetical protein JTB14_020785 [Gonioctena quinquepunctata]|nr:hypothetical protein JTB14_020785 [Gonioctena quinquepunctata]